MSLNNNDLKEIMNIKNKSTVSGQRSAVSSQRSAVNYLEQKNKRTIEQKNNRTIEQLNN